MTMDQDKLLEELKMVCETGFIKYTGLKLKCIGEGYAEGELRIEPYHLNPAGAIHGGLLFTLMDTVGGFATKTLDVLPTTLTSNINYLRPTLGTKRITVKASVIKRGKNVSVVRIDLYDEKEVLVASGAANYSDLSGKVKEESIRERVESQISEGQTGSSGGVTPVIQKDENGN